MKVLTALLFAAALLTGQTNDSAPPKRGEIVGTVVDGKTGAPVRKALVVIQHDQEDGIGANTDADGKFTLRDIEPRTYVITVEGIGYVVSRENARKVVIVNAGETNSDVKLTMLKTGVVSGRVLDVDGSPLVDARIEVTPLQKQKAGSSSGTFAVTNDLGEYRAFNLAPGEYRIAASYERMPDSRQVHVQAAPTPDGRAAPEAYQVTYYPGPVKIEPGSELHGFDVQMIRTRAVRLRGRLVGSPGLAFVTLQPIGPSSGAESHNVVVKDPKGEFELPDVLPGKYMLTAQGMVLNEEQKFTARQTLEVGDVDMADIQLTLGPPQRVTGRFIIPDGRKLPAGMIVALGSRAPADSQAGGFAQVASDGTFAMKDVAPGEYDLAVAATGQSDDLYISGIRMGETDALAEGVHIADGTPPPLEIVLKPNGGAVDCNVVDDKKSPVPFTHVALVPDAPRGRQAALFGDCKTDANGNCKITGIAPGDYHLYALPADTRVDLQDPDLLKPYESNSKAVSFDEGQQQQVQLTNAE